MSAADTARDVMEFYVTPSWVAKFYGVPKLDVYRAIRAGKLSAYRIRGSWDKRNMLVLDSRQLPAKFPR